MSDSSLPGIVMADDPSSVMVMPTAMEPQSVLLSRLRDGTAVSGTSAKTTVPFVRADSFSRSRSAAIPRVASSAEARSDDSTQRLRYEDSNARAPSIDHGSQSSSMSSVKASPASCNVQGQLFHAMISYRVATEGDGGNGLSLALYREIHRLSTTTCPLPLGSNGQWPTFARRPESKLENQAKVGSHRPLRGVKRPWWIRLENIMSKCSADDSVYASKFAEYVLDDEKILKVHRVKNRFATGYDDSKSVGYRDVSVQVEVGWVVGMDGMCWFVPVGHWRDPTIKIDRMICEIQIQAIHNVHSDKFVRQHARYQAFRNRMGR